MARVGERGVGWWPVVAGPAGALGAGLATGAFAAWAYYDDLLRPVAHTFGLWIALVALLAARRPFRSAVLRAGLALTAAVLAFYLGKQVMYGIEYPGTPYPLDVSNIVEWMPLALVAAVVLGGAFSAIGRPGAPGAAAAGAAVGLLLADAVRRAVSYPSDTRVVVPLAVLGAGAVLAVAVRTHAQLLAVLAWAVPMTAAGFAVVSAPDLLEELIVVSGL